MTMYDDVDRLRLTLTICEADHNGDDEVLGAALMSMDPVELVAVLQCASALMDVAVATSPADGYEGFVATARAQIDRHEAEIRAMGED